MGDVAVHDICDKMMSHRGDVIMLGMLHSDFVGLG